MHTIQIPRRVKPVEIGGSIYLNVPKVFLNHLKDKGVILDETDVKTTLVEDDGTISVNYTLGDSQ